MEKKFAMGAETVPLHQAFSRILARDIMAPCDHPFFDQSAVDGYVLSADAYEQGKPYVLAGEIKAGDAACSPPGLSEAVRIFTGAPVPEGPHAVVMQEETRKKNGHVFFLPETAAMGSNIRRKGEQIRAGAVALQAGMHLNPAAIGFLASLGIEKVEVTRLPSIYVINTGSEFALPGQKAGDGTIFESNGIMLEAALHTMNISIRRQTCRDEPAALATMVKEAAKECDVLILTGGVSVGDYDFTEEALQRNHFSTVFRKVAQKPGKPFLFAQREGKVAFGLPGNPRAVLVCFYMYVLPFLRACMGYPQPFLPSYPLTLNHDYLKKGDRAHFLAGKREGEGVTVLTGQDSHMLRSMSAADGIVQLPENRNEWKKGEKVTFYSFA